MSETRMSLAAAHRLPPPIPDALRTERNDGVVIRYDGMMRGEDPVVFAVMSAHDLAKLPGDVLEGLDFVRRDETGAPKASSYAFFVRSPFEVALYVDSDRHDDFISGIIATCGLNGLPVLNAQGDLKIMTNDHGDLDPPGIPAFIQNGWNHIPAREAIALVNDIREALAREAADPENRDDDSSLSPG